MDLTSLLGGILGARPKRHSQVARLFGGGGSLKTLMTAGALGWAAYEIFRTRAGAQGGGATVVPGTVVVPSSPPVTPGTVVVGSAPAKPPPLPASATAAALDPARRIVGVMLAAARADGALGEDEYGRVLARTREAGGASFVGDELRNPTPLGELAGGIPEPAAREDLYRLAFGIVRCDEGVSPAERAWLGRLAAVLTLDASTAQRLEREVTQSITSA